MTNRRTLLIGALAAFFTRISIATESDYEKIKTFATDKYARRIFRRSDSPVVYVFLKDGEFKKMWRNAHPLERWNNSFFCSWIIRPKIGHESIGYVPFCKTSYQLIKSGKLYLFSEWEARSA